MSDKIEKTEYSIALHQETIMDLEKIKKAVEMSETDNIRFKIETKHWYGFSEPFLGKKKHKLYLSKYSANALLETAIKIEKEEIDKLIDMEIQKRNERK